MGPVVILRFKFFVNFSMFEKLFKMTQKICSVYLVFSKIRILAKMKI